MMTRGLARRVGFLQSLSFKFGGKQKEQKGQKRQKLLFLLIFALFASFVSPSKSHLQEKET
jgi:hypothetical protein